MGKKTQHMLFEMPAVYTTPKVVGYLPYGARSCSLLFPLFAI